LSGLALPRPPRRRRLLLPFRCSERGSSLGVAILLFLLLLLLLQANACKAS
jgi:hypothetical protein